VTYGPMSAEVASRSKPANWVTTDSGDKCKEQNAKPANSVTTDLAAAMAVPGSERRDSASACSMYRERIEADLRRSRIAMGIWQDLVDQHGFAGGYQSVKRFVRPLSGCSSPRARVINDLNSTLEMYTTISH
jgi:hypothetical protein